MNARLFLCLELAAALLCAAPPASAGPEGVRRPSIALVVLDSVRADRLGAYGYARASTTVLDRLAGRAHLFEKAYANSNWTGSSFATILTGQLPFRHGVVGGLDVLAPGQETLLSALGKAGYETLFLFSGPDPERKGAIPDFEEQSKKAAAWLAGLPKEKDFFLLVHAWDVHMPYACAGGSALKAGGFPELTPELVHGFNSGPRAAAGGKYGAMAAKGASLRNDAAFLSAVSKDYDSCVTKADRQLGELLNLLEAAGRPLLVAVTADHGELLGEHGALGHGRLYFEPLIKVPLIISLPGQTSPGRIAAPAQHADLAPTLCAAAGAACGWKLDGTDLFSGAPGAKEGTHAAAGDNSGRGPKAVRSAAFRRGSMKLSLHNGKWSLFDLAADPGETRDFGPARPAEALAMAGAYLDLTGAGEIVKAPPPRHAKHCPSASGKRRGGAGPDHAFSAAQGRWSMAGPGSLVLYVPGSGLSCEAPSGGPASTAACLPAAYELLNCVEELRFKTLPKDSAMEDKLRSALKAAGYLP